MYIRVVPIDDSIEDSQMSPVADAFDDSKIIIIIIIISSSSNSSSS